MERSVLASVLVIGVAAAMLGAGTMANFSDTETSSNTFTAGTLEISLGTVTASANITNMQPGDTKTFSLTVSSVGTLPLDYTIATLLSGDIMMVDEDPTTGGIQNPNVPYVSDVRVDGVSTTSDTLTESGGANDSDTVVVEITLPGAAGNEYQGKSGTLDITFDAVQQ